MEKTIEELKEEIVELKAKIEDIEEYAIALSALEACGVDNWHGYDDAMTLLEEWQNED